ITHHKPVAEPPPVKGFPMRTWCVKIWLLDDQGNEVMPNVFEKATYNVHPLLERRKQVFKKSPWELVSPSAGRPQPQRKLLSLARALRGVSPTICHMPEWKKVRRPRSSTYPLVLHPTPQRINCSPRDQCASTQP
ncbi:hypothetical protein FB567DRAFT_455795, partial [Paraphoma chrysanthemicola]